MVYRYTSFNSQKQAEPKPHLFPFMEDPRSPLGAIYHRIHTTMVKIHDGKGSVDNLIKIAHERYKSRASGLVMS